MDVQAQLAAAWNDPETLYPLLRDAIDTQQAAEPVWLVAAERLSEIGSESELAVCVLSLVLRARGEHARAEIELGNWMQQHGRSAFALMRSHSHVGISHAIASPAARRPTR